MLRRRNIVRILVATLVLFPAVASAQTYPHPVLQAGSPRVIGNLAPHLPPGAPQQGSVVDFRAFIADTDGDGLKELVTADDNFTCLPTSLKIFESAPGDQMTLIFNQVIGSDLGNPVVADFDHNGRGDIVVADFSGVIYDFEAVA